MVLLVSAAFAADVNCNGLPANDEVAVDLADPVCAAQIDPATGLPYVSADAYYDYVSLGCTQPIPSSFDPDADGLSKGKLLFGGIEVNLDCDNCPTTSNPDQADADLDGTGDACPPVDINCNAVPADAETLVDLADPTCAANLDPATGQPYTSADRYYDYASFGCSYPLDDRFDTDGDGLGTGWVPSGAGVTLACDNCPSTTNPDQADADGDGIGDVCVDGLYLGWPSPGVTGTPNEVLLLDGTALTTVRIGASTTLGSFSPPACGAILELDTPFRFDTVATSADGVAFPTRNVPNGLAGQTVYFQAYEPTTCRVSNVVAWQF